MKKLKSLGFAIIYLLIPIVLQLVLSVMISFHIVAVRLLHGVEYDADKLEAWISSAQINMILIMLVNATIIVGVGIWYWYVRKVHQPVEAKDRYRKILAPRAIVTILLLAFASQFVCNILMIVFQNLFPAVYEDYVKLADTMSLKTMAAPAMIAIVGIFGPIAEELIFRGMVFRTLRKGFPFVVAALLSGACFGIYHMNWVQGVYASCLGVVLAFVYERTQSILGAILFHMFFNCSSYLLEQLGNVLPDGVLGLLYLIAMAVSVVAFMPLLRKVARLFPSPKKELQNRKETAMIQEEQNDENV
ncbi:cAAX amino terminal protease family protein [Roseburia sp. CAG:309]|nr:cAAX amino terminal protease family protein [Roseburia sp. CAG:309]